MLKGRIVYCLQLHTCLLKLFNLALFILYWGVHEVYCVNAAHLHFHDKAPFVFDLLQQNTILTVMPSFCMRIFLYKNVFYLLEFSVNKNNNKLTTYVLFITVLNFSQYCALFSVRYTCYFMENKVHFVPLVHPHKLQYMLIQYVM